MLLLQELQPFAIALALGLLIGIERERSHPPGIQAIGLRTFVLFSLLGAIAAWIKQPLVSCGITAFVAAIIVLSYLRSTSGRNKTNGIGITTEIAAILTYGLGFMVSDNPLITLIIGVAMVILLSGKQRLHTFSRESLHSKEFQATITILILALGILPFLPNTAIDPWLLFNPQRFGILVLVIAIMQFTAYAITRVFNAQRALLLSGLLMGFISSAIATATFSQQVKKGDIPISAAAAAIIYSTVSMYIKLLVIVALTSPTLLNWVSWPILIAIIVGMSIASYATKTLALQQDLPQLDNPLELWSALRLALMLGFMLIVLTLSERFLGVTATKIIAFIGGLFDIHSITFAISNLHRESELGIQVTMFTLGLAILASFTSKIIIVWLSKNTQFAIMSTTMLLAMLAATASIWVFVV